MQVDDLAATLGFTKSETDCGHYFCIVAPLKSRYETLVTHGNIDADLVADTSDMIQSHFSWVPFSKSMFLNFVVKEHDVTLFL